MLRHHILSTLDPVKSKSAGEVEKTIKLNNPDLFDVSTFDFRNEIWSLVREGKAVLDGFRVLRADTINSKYAKHNSSNPHNWLIEKAKQVSNHAYAPYSKFKVGAAIQTNQGIYTGCNVENASYGLTICAERNALVNMVANGTRTLEIIAIYTPTIVPTMPCGACRQFINEFAPECLIVSACDDPNAFKYYYLNELLKEAFGPHNLGL